MAYKNIDINELGLKQRIQYKSSRVAFFVPRLLSKLAKKVVLNPITKAIAGESYDDVKLAAQQGVMAYQNELADEMQEKIDEGQANLEAWKDDSEYYIGNMGKYKSYQSTINDLVKKQTKLRQSPKKLLVASTYVGIMKASAKEKKEEKKQMKMVKNIVAEYKAKQAAMQSKQLEMDALKAALAKSERDMAAMQGDLRQFATDNADILNQVDAQDKEATVDHMDAMSDFAKNGGQPAANANGVDFGLDLDNASKTM